VKTSFSATVNEGVETGVCQNK